MFRSLHLSTRFLQKSTKLHSIYVIAELELSTSLYDLLQHSINLRHSSFAYHPSFLVTRHVPPISKLAERPGTAKGMQHPSRRLARLYETSYDDVPSTRNLTQANTASTSIRSFQQPHSTFKDLHSKSQSVKIPT